MKSTAHYSTKCQRGGERKEQETLIMNLYRTGTIQMRMYMYINYFEIGVNYT